MLTLPVDAAVNIDYNLGDSGNGLAGIAWFLRRAMNGIESFATDIRDDGQAARDRQREDAGHR